MPEDEAKLIQRAKDDDPEAFAQLYERNQPAIYRYIFYRVEDVATAEDLTSEVFVRMVEKIDHFTYRGRPLLSWLYTIARNLIADHYRSREIPLDKHTAANLVGMTNLSEIVENKLKQERLARLFHYLTDAQRQVILLKFIEGFDNKKTAQILGKSVGAVKSLQYRALAALRRILEVNEE